jgi:hypothetical protein
MSDTQRHVHYTKVPFSSKLFYIGVGAALYYFAFAGGCQKAKAANEQASIPNLPVSGSYQKSTTTMEKVHNVVGEVNTSMNKQVYSFAPFMRDVNEFIVDTASVAKNKIEDMLK